MTKYNFLPAFNEQSQYKYANATLKLKYDSFLAKTKVGHDFL